jgi:hypothetical protein
VIDDRALNDAVVARLFHPTPEERRQAEEDPDARWFPDYIPDEAASSSSMPSAAGSPSGGTSKRRTPPKCRPSASEGW